jgi:hypothetical protein
VLRAKDRDQPDIARCCKQAGGIAQAGIDRGRVGHQPHPTPPQPSELFGHEPIESAGDLWCMSFDHLTTSSLEESGPRACAPCSGALGSGAVRIRRGQHSPVAVTPAKLTTNRPARQTRRRLNGG